MEIEMDVQEEVDELFKKFQKDEISEEEFKPALHELMEKLNDERYNK